MEKLEPCPFCGNDDPMVEVIPPHRHQYATFMPDYPGSAVIECSNDDCAAAIMADTLENAIRRWNRRVRYE